MRTIEVLAFLLCVTLGLSSQALGKPPTEVVVRRQAQCKFSDGNTITATVTHISGRNMFELATDEDLLTAEGMSVPAGHYVVLPSKDPQHDSWTLKMRSESAKGGSGELAPVPMSVTGYIMPVASFKVSFDQTGGSCMMHWRSDKASMVLSLEFTEKNTDLPLRHQTRPR